MAQTARRHPSGPLRFSRLIQFQDALFWDITTPPKVAGRQDDRVKFLNDKEHADLVSAAAFGTTRAAHVIMLRNETEDEPMRLWPNDFYAGREIRVPTEAGARERGLL